MKKSALVLALLLAITASNAMLSAALATEDLEAPTLLGIGVTPSTVDATTGDAQVHVDLQIEDLVSGFSGASVMVSSGDQQRWGSAGVGDLVAGNDKYRGTFRATITIPQYSRSGTWTVTQVELHDEVNNHDVLWGEDLEPFAGRSFTVDSQEDVDGPILESLDAPSSVDVTEAAQEVSLTVGVSDAVSGLHYGQVTFISPTGVHIRDANFESYKLIDGDINSGTYQTSLTIPRHAEAGQWKIQFVYLVDKAGNGTELNSYNEVDTLGAFQRTLDVTSPEQDLAGPELTSLAFSPSAVDVTSGPRTVAFEVGVSDSPAGLEQGFIRVVAPGGQEQWASFGEWALQQPGSLQSGVFTTDLRIPRFAANGTWTVAEVQLMDKTGNWTLLREDASRTDLSDAGFPTSFEVTAGEYDPSSSQATVTGGELVTTDDGLDGASAENPLETGVTSPNAGQVSIVETASLDPSPTGYSFFGQQVVIEAPDASPEDPLRLVFTIDSSLLFDADGNPIAIEDIVVLRDGVPAGSCPTPTTAPADAPCIADRALLGDGDVTLTVLTAHASTWNFATAAGTPLTFEGFLAPIDNPDAVNVGPAGKTYPFKWRLWNGDEPVTNLDEIAAVRHKEVPCAAFTGDPRDAIETTSTGHSELRYDLGSEQFVYNWRTPSTPGCYEFFVELADGSFHSARMKLK